MIVLPHEPVCDCGEEEKEERSEIPKNVSFSNVNVVGIHFYTNGWMILQVYV